MWCGVHGAKGGLDGQARVYDLERPTEALLTWDDAATFPGLRSSPSLGLPKPGAPIRCMRWCTEHLILLGFSDGSVCHWDMRSGNLGAMLFMPGEITDMQTGSVPGLVTVVGGNDVRVLHESTLQPAWMSAALAGKPLTAALHPSSKELAIGGADFRVRVVDMATLRESECMSGHFGPVHCVRYCGRQASTIVSSSEDGTIRLWKE